MYSFHHRHGARAPGELVPVDCPLEGSAFTMTIYQMLNQFAEERNDEELYNLVMDDQSAWKKVQNFFVESDICDPHLCVSGSICLYC